MNHDDITIGDLLDEGRRYVLHVGEYQEGNGFRATVVFEGFPGYFPIGEITNRLDAAPVLWWPTSDRAEAEAMAYKHSQDVLGLSKKDHMLIIMSSMGAQNKARRVQVKRDRNSGSVRLLNGYGVEMELDEEDAVALYQNLGRSMYLPIRESCPECGALLNDEDECEECEDAG